MLIGLVPLTTDFWDLVPMNVPQLGDWGLLLCAARGYMGCSLCSTGNLASNVLAFMAPELWKTYAELRVDVHDQQLTCAGYISWVGALFLEILAQSWCRWSFDALAMRCAVLFWLALEGVHSFETQSKWVANNATGCLDDPYYFDVFFLNLGRGTCRLSEYDTSGHGYGTAWRPSPTPTTLEDCLSLCFSLSYCTAVEFRTTTGDPRCEIWNQTVGYLRGSGSYVCVSQTDRAMEPGNGCDQEVDCSYFVGKNCTAEIYDRNASAKLERLHAACPNTCTEVVPDCPAGFTFRTTTVGGLYLTSAGEQATQKDQYASGYNLIFNVKGQESADTGFLELTSLSADGTIKEVEERAQYLISRVGAKLLLGPYGDETFEAVAEVAEAAKAVLLGPVSKRNESVAPRDGVFSLTRPYEETLLGPFQAIHQKGVATVSYIGPSASRAAALGLEANYRTCEKLPQTAEKAQLVFLRGEVLEDVSDAAWTGQVSEAVQRLLTPRPEVIVCCDSSLVCAFDILNATYQSKYDAKAFILLDDQHLTIPLNRATVDAWNNPAVELWLQQRMMDMGQVQSLEMINQWKSLSYSTMSAHLYATTWPVEMQEMMKDCLVVSDWDRNSAAAAGFIFLQHYQVRNHAQPESAAAWTSVAALLEAIRLANSTNPENVSEALMSLQMDAVLGHVTFDATGHRAQQSAAVQLAVAAEWQWPAGMLRFDVHYLQPHGRDTLKYPKQTWRETYCWNEHLLAPDGLNYGLVLNNDTGLEECSPCSNGETSRWDHRNRKRICETCAAGTETFQGTCRPCQAGYFSDSPGSPRCSPCSAGSYQSSHGQSSCRLCPAGTFSSQSASASCTSCTDTWDATNPAARPRWAAEGSAACETCLVGASCEPDANGVYGNFTNSDGYYLFPPQLLHASHDAPLYPLFRCNHGNGLACLKGGKCYVHPETQNEAMTGPMRPGSDRRSRGRMDLGQQQKWVAILAARSGSRSGSLLSPLLSMFEKTWQILLLVLAFVHQSDAIRVKNEVAKPWAEMSQKEQYLEAAWWANATYDQTDADEHAIFTDRYSSEDYTECVFGIRGTRDVHDWTYNLNILTTDWDVWTVHRGFADKILKLMASQQDLGPGFLERLQALKLRNQIRIVCWMCSNAELFKSLKDKCSLLILVGHSLGGAMASLYAAAADEWGLKGADYLYTFAAPAVATSPLHRFYDCFPGARFFIADNVTHYDVVPAVANWVGYVHPLIDTVRISAAPEFGEDKYLWIPHTCWNSSRLPKLYASTAFTTMLMGYKNQPLPFHKMHGLAKCGTCRPGYAKPIGQPLELCRHCGSRTVNFLGLGLQLLTVFSMAAFLMIVNFLSDYSKPKNILSIILKQLFNYTQMATAVLSTGGDHGLYAGFSVVGIFDMVQDYLGFSSSAWIPEAGACLIQELLPSWGIQKVITLVGLAWFPGTALVSTMVFLFVKLVRRLVFQKTTHLRHLKTWLMVNFFLYIPRVNRLLLANFKCQTYDTSRLMADPTVACWERDHAMWQTLSWIGIGVFSVGGPLLLYLILRRYEKRQLLGTYRVLRTYGFLFAGFEPDFYYFECVYMFRKLCFEFVMTIPGMTSENEEILGRINSSSVAFVASVFFALHMACQPYDNRDYFILDHIETASLRAILVTAFLQLWCLNTNEADGILHNTWLRECRNVICTVVILLFHLRFFWLFFYGIARRRIQSCVSACRGRDFSHGIVKFVPDGLQLHNLNGTEEMLLKTLVSEIFDIHMQAKRKIAYDQWSGSLQMLCLEARRQHIENELLALDKVGNTLRSWREISRKLFHGSRVGLICERIFDRMESAYGLVSKSGGYENTKKQKDKELEDLKIFCADSLNKILNKEFRVDELQDSMLSLGKSICDNKRIGGLGENMKVEDETMSQALEFYVGPLDMDEHVAIALQERASIKEVTELRKEVDERQKECAELRRLINQYRAKRKQGLGTEDEECPVEDPRAERLEELEVQLQKSMKALSEAREERDAAQAEVQRLQGDLDKEEDLKEEAKGAMEEQQSKIHSLEEQLRKLQQNRISCWSCHAKLPEDAVYCYKCGKALHGEL
eukprot:s1037_g12.t2